MMKLNTILTVEQPKELSSDYEYICFHDDRDYLHNDSYLPGYVREAMRKNGVIRTSDGKFVKVHN